MVRAREQSLEGLVLGRRAGDDLANDPRANATGAKARLWIARGLQCVARPTDLANPGRMMVGFPREQPVVAKLGSVVSKAEDSEPSPKITLPLRSHAEQRPPNMPHGYWSRPTRPGGHELDLHWCDELRWKANQCPWTHGNAQQLPPRILHGDARLVEAIGQHHAESPSVGHERATPRSHEKPHRPPPRGSTADQRGVVSELVQPSL